MNGMLTVGFGASTDSDLARSFSFDHEFAPTSMICELSLTALDENDDEAGATVGFSGFTFEDDNGTPHHTPVKFEDRRAHVGHNRIRRVEWFLRIYNARAKGLFNAFFWDDVR